MILVEVLALCGIVQIITTSYLLAPLRASLPTEHLKHLVSCTQCMGFWVGFIVYAVVAICSVFAPISSFSLPIADMVASSDVYVKPVLVLLFGGLVSVCSLFANHVIEFSHFCKLWYVGEVEKQINMNEMVKQANDISKELQEFSD